MSAQNHQVNLAQLLYDLVMPPTLAKKKLSIAPHCQCNKDQFLCRLGLKDSLQTAHTCLSNPYTLNKSRYFPFMSLFLCSPISSRWYISRCNWEHLGWAPLDTSWLGSSLSLAKVAIPPRNYSNVPAWISWPPIPLWWPLLASLLREKSHSRLGDTFLCFHHHHP